jgi:hypothetical protein
MKLYIGDTPEQLGSYQTADAIIVGDKVVTKADYLALVAQSDLLNAHLKRMQVFAAKYITPNGRVGDAEFIEQMIYLLDGPEQRKAQATPQQCLREIQAEAGLVGYFRGTDDAWQALVGTSSPEQMTAHLATQYAERIRQGGE